MSDPSADDRLRRWKCVSYCRCDSRKGHFVVDDDGTWVQFSDVEAVTGGHSLRVMYGTLEKSGLSFSLVASKRATNQDLRDVAALLIRAADILKDHPERVDTEISA